MLETDTIYSRIMEIEQNKFFSNREKLILCFDDLKKLFNQIVADDNITYTEYALFHYVLRRFDINLELKTNIIKLRKYIVKIRKYNKLYPTKFFIEQAIDNIIKLISIVTNTEIPAELSKLISDTVLELPLEAEEIQSSKNRKIVALITHKLSSNTIIICQNDENKYAVIIEERLTYLCAMAKRLNTICFTNLEETEKIISNMEEENELFNDCIFYKTSNRTQIILEPNFLIDVTELTDCFQLKNSNPVISILKRLYPNNITSKAAFEGNIINHFFDELLENIEVDFDTCIKNALQKNLLTLYSVALQHSRKIENKKSYVIKKYLKDSRKNWFDKFTKLRDIIIANFLDKTNIVEPSFISDTFGLQGRLDLMTENKKPSIDNHTVNQIVENSSTFNENITIKNEQTKTINILELKSSKPPTKFCNATIGLFNKRTYNIPLWINHFIQVVCYNMLLEHIIEKNNFEKGSSTILYAEPTEPSPLRSVVEDNINVQNEILLFRNYIITFLYEIADKNITFIENIDIELIENTFPKYDIDRATKFIDKLKNISDLEKSYFKTQLSFVVREMFAQKIGIYADNYNRNNGNGFSSLWLNSIEEKRLSGNIICDLFLDLDKSDFNKMHLTFNRNSNDLDSTNNYTTAFRKGDICLMYPIFDDNLSLLPIDNQLFRGRILELNDNFIKVSFRNKLFKKMFIEK